SAPYLSVPTGLGHDRIQDLCLGLLGDERGESKALIGSIRSSNVIAFLHEFAQILKGKFELKEVAQAITERTSALFEAEGAAVLVPNEDASKFRFAYLYTPSDEVGSRLAELEVPADRGVTGWVARHQRSILIDDVSR